MIYDHLGQDATMTATTSTTTAPSRTFFQRMFPTFFPVRPSYYYDFTRFNLPPPRPACIPSGPLPAGVLGRDSNGNLTINGQTYCIPGGTSQYSRPGPVVLY
jgi:hypothetical protein